MARVVMIAVGQLDMVDVVPHYVVRDGEHVYVLGARSYLKEWLPKYSGLVDFRELRVNSEHELPMCGMYFLNCCHGLSCFGPVADENRRTTFNTLWDCSKSQKGTNAMKIKNPSCKALMLFGRKDSDTPYDICGYSVDVFVWNSVDGVRRMNFGQYLDLISDKHDATYALHKIQRKDLQGIVQDDFDKFVAYCSATNTNYKDMRAIMWFRSLWYAATEEVMDV